IQIISEKTGYDIEDIDVDFDLEEDLGIDTVKQAEIFGELRNQLNISEDTEINLVGLGTINNIIEKIQEYVIDQNIESDASVVQDRILSQQNLNDDINQVKNLVKKVIADKTGYEIEDIDDEYDLEEDLGIDTVKQAEIFGELRTNYNLEDTIEINLADIRTPNAIIEFIMQFISEESKLSELSIRTTKDISKSKEKSEEVDSIGISQVVPTRVFKLVLSEKTPKFDNIKTLIININSGLSNYKNLIEDFKNFGMDIYVYNVNGDIRSVEDLKNEVTEVISNKEFKMIILISPDYTQYSIDDSLAIFDNLFLIFKSLNLLVIEKILVISPENMFGWEQGANPLCSSISAFIKTINREFQIPIKIIASKNPKQITQEFLGWDKLEEIAYKDNVRYTLLRKKIEDIPEPDQATITKDDVLLVTGGAQGITFACIDDLTNHIKPELILLGLAPLDDSFYEYINYSSDMLDEKKQEFVKELKSKQDKVTPVIINKEWKKFLDKLDTLRNVENLKNKGLLVQYYAVDITNEEEMKVIFQKIKKQTKKPITIIIHGAGIEESKSFLKKNLNLAHKIVSVKVGGFSNIIKSIKLQDVKYFIAFASVAGRYGNQGQIDYAFANAYLSRLAWKFNQQNIQFLTFDWTAWGEIGMATRGSTLQILTQAGVTSIPSKTGTKIFSKLVLNNFTGEYIIAGNLGLFEEMLDVGEAVNKLDYPMIKKINYQPDHIIGLNTINSEVDTYLLDHQIQQKPVFPGVMVLETFAELYYRMFNKPMNYISNISFHTPLKIPRGKSVDVEIIFNKSSNEIKLLSKTFLPVLKGKPLIKEHFSALFEEPLIEMNWKKEPILEPIIPLLDKTQIYELFFHGKKFQVLKEIIQLEKEQIITKVDLPQEPLTNNIEGDKFQLNPLAIESVFQTAALFDFIINNHLSLPSKISSLKIISNQRPKYILTKFLKIDEERSYFNSAIMNENQEVIALIENSEIIHTQISVILSNNLLDYFSTLLEYYKLKNTTQKQEIEIIPIVMIKKSLERDPQFLEKYLTKREIENSERFRNLKRKIEYFSGIIAAKESYIKSSPMNISYHDIEIQKDEKGKPFYYSLKNNQIVPLNLSITHSNEFSISMISKNLIGIDLEKIESRSESFYMEAFTESEREAISEDDLLGTIYWTAKEALSKAIGEGTHINFRDIELKYNNNNQNFSVNLTNTLVKFNKKIQNLQLSVEFNEKYVLSYCEIKNFKEHPIIT
ncbi:MAG: SDR family NAD(P)-dependent oxidoreductase, partial [Promethearchaeota archaeon]